MLIRHVLRLAAVASLSLLACSIGNCGAAAAAQLPDGCLDAAGKARVLEAYKVPPIAPASQGNAPAPAPAPPAQTPDTIPTVSLDDTIGVKVEGLAELKQKCGQAPIVLFLNGYPLKTVRPFPPSPPPTPATGNAPSIGELRFILTITDGSKATDGTVIAGGESASESWRPILGRPPWPWQPARTIKVSAGLDGQYPLPAKEGDLPTFRINILGTIWFLIWGAFLLGMIAVFYWAVFHTNIIRSGNPSVPARVNGTYSLSKFQGAWWFFVILAAYALIGIVTGDYLASINSTAVILLGIGAGTVIGSAIIDKNKTEDPVKARNEIDTTKQQIDQLSQSIKAIDDKTAPAAELADPNRRTDLESRRKQLQSNYYKLTGQSEGFFTDILSDADGISFHRFQLAVWTVILGFIFIRGVYDNLAMPIFDTTLMGLLGLSAGTYLGLKIPEATSPTAPPPPRG